MNRVAIVGSRGFPDLERVRAYVRNLPAGTIVVSGWDEGSSNNNRVDRAAILEARRVGLPTKTFVPDWKRFGRSAGFKRNAEIECVSDRCVAFWDGTSRGTSHTMLLFSKNGKPVEVFRP